MDPDKHQHIVIVGGAFSGDMAASIRAILGKGSQECAYNDKV